MDTMPIDLPNLTETQKSFNSMQTNLLSLNTAINNLQEDEKERDKKVNKLNEVVLIGNGEVAIRETVRTHTAFINEIKYWMKFVIGVVIAQLLTFSIAAVIVYIKFLPVLEKLATNQP